MLKNKLASDIKRVLGVSEVALFVPEISEHGDFSTNVAMQQKGKNPRETANDFVGKLSKDKTIQKYISKIEVAGPGFINFWLSDKYLLDNLKDIQKEKDSYGAQKIGDKKTVVVDYSAPNIAKRFSIGHLRSTIIGQTILNLYKFLGYKTVGDNHLGDWGTQFGKLLFMIDKEGLSPSDLTIEKLEDLYVNFHELAEKNPELEEKGREWFMKLEKGDERARKLWKYCVDKSTLEFDRIYELLGVKIDFALGESFYEDLMKEMQADKKLMSNVSEGENGARVIDLSHFGIKTPLMLMKSDGATTYAFRDLATIKYRMEQWPDTKLIIYEVGAEQSLHFQQVFAAARKLNLVTDDVELVHLGHGLYLDENGKKFKTRKGGTVNLEDVLDEAIQKATQIAKKNEGNKAIEIGKIVGIGAIKYYDLMHHPASNIVFDWNSIMNLEGNSGPYLQYTVARGRSVIEKSDTFDKEKKISSVKTNVEEKILLRSFAQFSGVITDAAKNYSPNLLCNYLFDLAQKYNSFYNKHKIIGGENENLRLAVTFATSQILATGLSLLGIEAPKKM